ncbi:TPA: hypothetical protein ACH3X1_016411 [Trebouxia sp. C0004]
MEPGLRGSLMVTSAGAERVALFMVSRTSLGYHHGVHICGLLTQPPPVSGMFVYTIKCVVSLPSARRAICGEIATSLGGGSIRKHLMTLKQAGHQFWGNIVTDKQPPRKRRGRGEFVGF